MNINIEKDPDFSEFEVHTKSDGKPDAFTVSKDISNYDAASDDDKSFVASRPTLTETSGKPRLTLEKSHIDLLVNDANRKFSNASTTPGVTVTAKVADDTASVRSHNSVHSHASIRDRKDQEGPSFEWDRYPSPAPSHHGHDDRSDAPRYESKPDRHYDTRSEVSYKPEFTYEEIQQQKRELLYQFERMEKRNIFSSKKFTMESDLNEMKHEYEKIKNERDADQAITFYRTALRAFVQGSEWLNAKYSPFPLRLEGWSDSVEDNVESYDDVFIELHDKYKSKMRIPPELKLLAMVAGSGFMMHISNTICKSSAMPDMADILNNDPDLMRRFQAAAVNRASAQNPNLGGLFGMMGSMGANIPGQGPSPSNAPTSRAQPTSAPPPQPVQRREMSSPGNWEDYIGDSQPARSAPPPKTTRQDDARSVRLSEVNDADRVSQISSLDERDLKDTDVVNITRRPDIGMRPNRREVLINNINNNRSGRSSKSPNFVTV